jgi:hypothetical protein
MNVSELPLSLPTIGILESQGIDSVEDDLLPLRGRFRAKIKYVGAAREEEIERALQAAEIGTPIAEPPSEDPPPREEVGAEPPPFALARPGDLVVFTSEYGRRRWAWLDGMKETGEAEVEVKVGGGTYREKAVPYSAEEVPMSWHPKVAT